MRSWTFRPTARPAASPARAFERVEHDVSGRGQWHEAIELGVFATNATGAALLIAAVALAVLNLVMLLLCTLIGVRGRLFFPLDSRLHGGELSLITVRISLGALVCCALQLLVVADILDTMGHPVERLAFETLGKLLFVVIIREGLAYVTAAELGHLRQEQEQRARAAADLAAGSRSDDHATTMQTPQRPNGAAEAKPRL
ncbi:hypothetical protein KFE25_005689 [Diacronema lutheri]|uniref:DUF1622 domain-containing protein n=1 Tax=Diacronema lutheri TaxID=2081491 RepID=A0A8J5X9F7_DIALT|nr:hypothetical protein KFE25_005689 [Diacronema lutheri]